MFIIWLTRKFSTLHNYTPDIGTLLYGLISPGENSVHFLQLLPFTTLHFSFHHVPVTAGRTEMVWYARLARHLYSLHMAGSVTGTLASDSR